MEQYLPLIKIYKELPADVQRYLAKNPDPRWTRLISEICLNLQNRKIPLHANEVKRLRKYSGVIKALGDAKKAKAAKRRKRIIQKGLGLIPLLISTVAPFLLSLFK